MHDHALQKCHQPLQFKENLSNHWFDTAQLILRCIRSVPASSAKALPAEPDPALCPSMDIPIIAETESFVCVYKPAGIPFHRVKNQPGILELLRQTGRFSDRLYPVHRLDQLTSGLILFGRGRKATNELGNHFRFGRIKTNLRGSKTGVLPCQYCR